MEDWTQDLFRLKKLHDLGDLTDTEYTAAKAKLLDREPQRTRWRKRPVVGVVFGENNLYPPHHSDCWMYRQPFMVLRASKGPERFDTSVHDLRVDVSDQLKRLWDYPEDDLKKVLFEYGRKEVHSRITQSSLDAAKVHVTVSGLPPRRIDPMRLGEPDGAVYEWKEGSPTSENG